MSATQESELRALADAEPPSLELLAASANQEALEAAEAGRQSLRHAWRCGRFLLEAKLVCGHGSFISWIRANCVFSDRSARLYMRLAKLYETEEKLATVADFTIGQALRLAIAGGPSEIEHAVDDGGELPPEKREELLKRARRFSERSFPVRRFAVVLRQLWRFLPRGSWLPGELVANLSDNELRSIFEIAELAIEWLDCLAARAAVAYGRGHNIRRDEAHRLYLGQPKPGLGLAPGEVADRPLLALGDNALFFKWHNMSERERAELPESAREQCLARLRRIRQRRVRDVELLLRQ